MATYYPRDLGHVLYAEPSLPGNLYMNYSSSVSANDNLGGSSGPEHNATDLPVPTNISSSIGDPTYSSWSVGRSELPFVQAIGGSIDNADELLHNSPSDDPQMGLGMQLNILTGQNVSLQQSNLSTVQGRGLSLSLGTQIPGSSFHFHPSNSNVSYVVPHQKLTSRNVESTGEDNSREKQIHAYPSPYGHSSLASVVPNSKYLKAAQKLLDEVVNVQKALKSKSDKSQNLPSAINTGGRQGDEGSKSDEMPANPNESARNSSNEPSPSERQDLQNKLTKLLAMLDEVDRRYKQYYHQMQIVVSSFDVIAGCGAAKPYTALALQTISIHFRCLRDAINGQIQAARRSLGEQDGSRKDGGISRLRYIDQKLRQKRVFQQFGMMPQHAWRPQRGLPENSVSILRAWLFEHFLHPYPKDSDKILLSRQTGLTRSQVSNWFINARVRLWKPMVEEMYKEEIGDAEIDSISSLENAPQGRDELRLSADNDEHQSMKFVAEKYQSSHFDKNTESCVLLDVEEGCAATSYQNDINAEGTMDYNLLQGAVQPHSSGRYLSHQSPELGRYGNAGVSLTLGLQHCEGGVPVSDGQHSFISTRGDEMFNATPLVTDAVDYNYMNLTDSRHRFGSSQLLHDFVT